MFIVRKKSNHQGNLWKNWRKLWIYWMRILSTTQMVFCQREIRRMSKIWSGSLVTKKGYRTKNLKWPMDIGEMSLPIEIWAFVLTYLLSLDLFYLSICSKSFYSIVHQNKKFKRRFGHSKKLVCGVQFYYQLTYEFEKDFYQAYNCFATDDICLYLKKKLLPTVIFKILRFRVYSNFFLKTQASAGNFVAVTYAVKLWPSTYRFLIL